MQQMERMTWQFQYPPTQVILCRVLCPTLINMRLVTHWLILLISIKSRATSHPASHLSKVGAIGLMDKSIYDSLVLCALHRYDACMICTDWTLVLDNLFFFFLSAFVGVSMFDVMFQLNACNWFDWIIEMICTDEEKRMDGVEESYFTR